MLVCQFMCLLFMDSIQHHCFGGCWDWTQYVCGGGKLTIRAPANHYHMSRDFRENFHFNPESVATLPPFSPIEEQKWFDQISSQWESQKNRFALIYFGKIRFLPPCIWNIPFVSYSLCTHSSMIQYKDDNRNGRSLTLLPWHMGPPFSQKLLGW